MKCGRCNESNSWPIEIVAVLVRLAASENAALDFHVAPLQTGVRDAERDVGRILPMMTDAARPDHPLPKAGA